MKISRFAVRHPVYITMILIALIAFGVLSITGMNIEFVTSGLSTPEAYVIAIYPGASASEVEEDVIKVLEEDFVTLPGFSSMTSTSSSSYGAVLVSYQDGIDIYDQLEELRSRIDQLMPSLPEGLQGTPMVVVGGTEMLPIMTVTAEGGKDIIGMTDYIEDELIPMITRIEGVSNVSISGGSEAEIEIKLRTDSLSETGISPLQVYQILQYNNINLPLGSSTYHGAASSLRFQGRYSSIDELGSITVGASEDGSPVKLADIADIAIKGTEPDTTARREGKDIISLNVYKRADGNTLKITSSVRKILEEEEATLNGGMHFSVIADDGSTITASLSGVIQSGFMGIAVAVLVLLLCLGNIQSTLIIAVSMPLSVFFTFIGMKLCGITINLLSITGIVIALGSIVDGSIVMLDQINHNYALKKDGVYINSVNESIYKASDMVTMAILGSAITTVVVFIPILFIDGLIGTVLYDVSATFMMAIAGSALTAIVIIPFLAKQLLPETRKEKKSNILMRGMEKLTAAYGKSVRYVISNRKFIIFISLVILALTIWAVLQLGMAFIPSTDNSEIYVNVTLPENYTREMTKAKTDYIEEVVRENLPELKEVITTTGTASSGIAIGTADNLGSVRITLERVKDRKRDVHEIILELQTLLDAKIPDADISVENGGFDNLVTYLSGGGGWGITLLGNDMRTLYSEAERIKDELEKDPEVITASIDTSYNIYSSVISASSEYMNSLGVTPYEAAITASVLFNGMDAGVFRSTDGKNMDIRITSDAADYPIDENLLSRLAVNTSDGRNLSFAAVSSLLHENDISSISHSDRIPSISVSATTTSENSAGISSRMNRYLEEYPLAEGVTEEAGGMVKLLEDSIYPIIMALVIAIFLVYMVMVFQFERFNQPLLIMITIPFCIIGVAIGLLAFGSTINIISMLGIIALAGTAVNNGIILMDYMNGILKRNRIDAISSRGVLIDEDTCLTGQLSENEELVLLDSSITEAAQSRLRSILMTTLTTMLGVVPMAISPGEGSELYAPLGQVIAGGLLATTAVSLFLMPVLYRILEGHQIKKTYRRERRKKR